MSDATYIEDAIIKTRCMVHRETRGPGDTENAMRRLAHRYGIDFRTLWSLRYRPPRALFVSIYFAIQTAYEAECERQSQLLADERAATHPETRIGRALMRKAAGVAGENLPVVRDE